MNTLQQEQVIAKDFPELAEGMAAHCITTTVPDEPNGQPLELWVMPIGQVVSWMKIAAKKSAATARAEGAAEERERIAGWIRSKKEEWDESGRYVNGEDKWGEEYVRHAKMDWDSRNLLLENLSKSLEALTTKEHHAS